MHRDHASLEVLCAAQCTTVHIAARVRSVGATSNVHVVQRNILSQYSQYQVVSIPGLLALATCRAATHQLATRDGPHVPMAPDYALWDAKQKCS
jgi:hypothetical protein